MLNCIKCNTELDEETRFCDECGAEQLQRIFCDQCGAELESGVRFCDSCGAEYGTAVPTSVKPKQAASKTMKNDTPNQTVIKLSDEIKNFTKELERIELSNTDINKPRGSIIPFVIAAGLFFFGIICLFLGMSEIRFPSVAFAYFLTMLLVFSLGLIAIIAPKPRMSPAEKQKRAFIENAVISNTKEVIIEFFNFAIFQIEDVNSFLALILPNQKYTQLWNKVWKSKCKQVYNKAKLSMVSDPQGLKAMKDILTSAGLNL